MNKYSKMRMWIVGALLLVIAGCAGKTPPPEFSAPSLNANSIESITVLSVVDHRIDKSKRLKLDKWTKGFVKKRLKKAGYQYSFETAPEYISAITPDGLEDSNSEMISGLGPNHSRWVLVLVLEDSSAKFTLGSAGAAEMTGYLYDKLEQTLLWRNKELGEFHQAGLMGIAMKGVMERTAIEMASDKVLMSFPRKK